MITSKKQEPNACRINGPGANAYPFVCVLVARVLGGRWRTRGNGPSRDGPASVSFLGVPPQGTPRRKDRCAVLLGSWTYAPSHPSVDMPVSTRLGGRRARSLELLLGQVPPSCSTQQTDRDQADLGRWDPAADVKVSAAGPSECGAVWQRVHWESFGGLMHSYSARARVKQGNKTNSTNSCTLALLSGASTTALELVDHSLLSLLSSLPRPLPLSIDFCRRRRRRRSRTRACYGRATNPLYYHAVIIQYRRFSR